MNDRIALWFETAVGTIGIAGMVGAAAWDGPGALRALLAVGGTALVCWTFYSIFEALEIQCYRTFTDPDGDGGGGPDDGERVPEGVTSGPFRGKLNVYDFPKRAA